MPGIWWSRACLRRRVNKLSWTIIEARWMRGGVALSLVRDPDESLFVDWRPYLNQDTQSSCDTRFDLARFQYLAGELQSLPDGFMLHRQVQKLMEDRQRMAAGAMPINWGFAETMAYATLLDEASLFA